jgi:hypothetical protein
MPPPGTWGEVIERLDVQNRGRITKSAGRNSDHPRDDCGSICTSEASKFRTSLVLW